MLTPHLLLCCLQGPPRLGATLCSSCSVQQHEVDVLEAHALQGQLHRIQRLLVGLCCIGPSWWRHLCRKQAHGEGDVWFWGGAGMGRWQACVESCGTA